MKKLVELSSDDLETLRTMSKRFPKRNRNAETPEELSRIRRIHVKSESGEEIVAIGPSSTLFRIVRPKREEQNRESFQNEKPWEAKLPQQGVKIVFGIVVGIWIAIAVVGWLWSLFPHK